jgi:hypothetical protein
MVLFIGDLGAFFAFHVFFLLTGRPLRWIKSEFYPKLVVFYEVLFLYTICFQNPKVYNVVIRAYDQMYLLSAFSHESINKPEIDYPFTKH